MSPPPAKKPCASRNNRTSTKDRSEPRPTPAMSSAATPKRAERSKPSAPPSDAVRRSNRLLGKVPEFAGIDANATPRVKKAHGKKVSQAKGGDRAQSLESGKDTGLLDNLKSDLGAAKDAIQSSAEGVVNTVGELATRAGETASETPEDMKDAASSAVGKAKGAGDSVVHHAKDVGEHAEKSVSDAVETVQTGASDAVKSADYFLDEAKNEASDVAGKVEDAGKSAADSAAEFADNTAQKVQDAARYTVNAAAGVAENAIDRVQNGKDAGTPVVRPSPITMYLASLQQFVELDREEYLTATALASAWGPVMEQYNAQRTIIGYESVIPSNFVEVAAFLVRGSGVGRSSG